MTTIPHRQARGIPAGGQFAVVAHALPGFSLALQRDQPNRPTWTDKKIRAVAAARYVTAQALERDLAAADAVLDEKKRLSDWKFFDWDTDFAAGSFQGRFRRFYLKDRAALREMFAEDPDYRYNREYAHKALAPLRESAQMLLNRALNRFEEHSGAVARADATGNGDAV